MYFLLIMDGFHSCMRYSANLHKILMLWHNFPKNGFRQFLDDEDEHFLCHQSKYFVFLQNVESYIININKNKNETDCIQRNSRKIRRKDG